MARIGITMQSQAEEPKIEEIRKALQSVLTGHSFGSTPQCQALLRYIVEHSLFEEIDMLRERQIGINVFGRVPDYDTGNDPIVRARAAEVRKRLAQHYLRQDHVDEEIQIKIPSGSYRAVFEKRAGSRSGTAHRETEKSNDAPALSADSGIEPLPSIKDASGMAGSHSGPRSFWHLRFSRPRRIALGTISGAVMLASAAVVIGGLGFGAGSWTENHRSEVQRGMPGAQPAFTGPSDSVTAFWAPFLKEDPSPIIVYSDATFLIDDSGNLFRYRHGAADDRGARVSPGAARQYASSPELVNAAGDLFYDNGYTGTGDLRAVAALVTLFSRMGASPQVESSHELITDDLERHNVIVIGSPIESVAFAQFIPKGDFLFADPDLHDPWSGTLINTRPQPGEQPEYKIELDPRSHRIRGDYALFLFRPGLAPGRQIVILAGIDTTGCDGAALFATSKAGAEEISNALRQRKTKSQPQEPTPTGDLAFQALLHIDVARGYQVLDSHLVSLHPFNAIRPSTHNDSSLH